ncbi:dynein regulatory complex subunit 2-like [Lycorma delicatula]|uniref:dynein regulatory complex subunit 2-like n=1 Tax=Lycorma delicatula TaxID=130591 RepID=UPI003F51A7D3
MGPKKKGKGSKLARMSEEEKIRYLQHRAAIEEEARRRKEQLISTFMKNKLKHEEAFIRLNSAKINQQWRHLLRKYKCKELKDDMEALWKSFEKTLSLKNKLIDTLLLDLEDAETQYAMMFQSHTESIGKIIGLHEERLGKLFEMYKKDRENMLKTAAAVRTHIENDGARRCEHLQAIVFEMNERHMKEQKGAECSFTAKQDELRNQMLTEIEKSEEFQHSQLEMLWQTMQKILRDYNNSIAPMKVHYNTLCERDTNNSAELLKHCEFINKYSDIISILKQQLVLKQKEGDEEIKKLKKEQSYLLEKFQEFRNNVTKENNKAHTRLTKMSVTSTNIIEKVTEITEKGERLLQLNLNCQKYLTQMEKVLPSYCKGPILPVNDQEQNVKEEEDSKEAEEKVMSEPFDKLDNFWKQYNEVLLETQTMHLQHQSCLAENRQLKRLLRHYLNTLARPSSVPNISAARTEGVARTATSAVTRSQNNKKYM